MRRVCLLLLSSQAAEIVVKHGFCGLHELLSEVVVMVLVDEFVN